MEYIKTGLEISEEILNRIDRIIAKGGFCIVPFDTVYGVICDPFSSLAVENIINFKNRPANKTIGLAFDSIESLKDYVSQEDIEFIESKEYGKYTFIVDSKCKKFAPQCYKDNTIGIRIPDSSIVKQIATKNGGVIAQTSANLSGQKNCLSYPELQAQFGKKLNDVDLIIDSGPIINGRPSQIYDLTGVVPKIIAR